MWKRAALIKAAKALGPCVRAYYVIFQFSPRIHAPILPDKLQKIIKHFQYGYKTKTKLKHRTHYAIFQNLHICASRPAIWLGALCGLCVLLIYKLLAACACECGLSGCLCGLGLYGHLWRESVRVFDGLFVFVSVDVKYIIRYRRMCKFICTL